MRHPSAPTPSRLSRLAVAVALLLPFALAVAPVLASDEPAAQRDACPLDKQAAAEPASSKPSTPPREAEGAPGRGAAASEPRSSRSRWQSMLPGMMK